MAYQYILYDKEDGVAILTLNRPDKLNAWMGQMKLEIINAIQDADRDPGVGALIVTGAGRAFSAGQTKESWGAATRSSRDKAETPSFRPPENDERTPWLLPTDTPRLVLELLNFRKPSIAAINGVVAGGPISLICGCDIRIASDRASFRTAFGRRGHILNVGVSYWLPRIIGIGHTLELAYTNDVIDANEMERIGLVNRVVPHDELIPYCKEMAKKMALTNLFTLNATKKVVLKSIESRTLEEVLVWESWGMRGISSTEDYKEAEKSLFEKRDPMYKGR